MSVLLAFLHSSIPGEEARFPQAVAHGDNRLSGLAFSGGGDFNRLLRFGRKVVHPFKGASHSLANGASLPRDSTTVDKDLCMNTANHGCHIEGAHDGDTILGFGEKVFKLSTVDHDIAGAFKKSNPGDGSLSTASSEIICLFIAGFSHG